MSQGDLAIAKASRWPSFLLMISGYLIPAMYYVSFIGTGLPFIFVFTIMFQDTSLKINLRISKNTSLSESLLHQWVCAHKYCIPLPDCPLYY